MDGMKLGDRIVFGAGEGILARVVAMAEGGVVIAAAIATGVTRGVAEAYGFSYFAVHPLGCRERMLKLLPERDVIALREKGLLRPAPAGQEQAGEAPF